MYYDMFLRLRNSLYTYLCVPGFPAGQVCKAGRFGNPSHSPIGKYFPNSKYENVKNKQIQLFIFASAGAKILDLFDSEHPYLEFRKSLLREFTQKGDFILMATGVPTFLLCVV